MSTMDHHLMQARERDGYAETPLPPVSVLLQLASLVLVLAVEVGKGYITACVMNAKERLIANPRARGDARNALSDRN